MGVDFGSTIGHSRYILVPQHSAVNDMSQRTICFWFYANQLSSGSSYHYLLYKHHFNLLIGYYGLEPNPAEWVSGIHLLQGFSTTGAAWHSSYPSASTWYHYAVSYDRSSSSNDPTAYLNGSSVSITEQYPPSGSAVTDADHDLYLAGTASGSGAAVVLEDVRIYNRLLSATEVAGIYSRKCIGDLDQGLVFNLDLLGASGLQVFEASSLGGTNVLYDRLSGSSYAPSGSPTGKMSNRLSAV